MFFITPQREQSSRIDRFDLEQEPSKKRKKPDQQQQHNDEFTTGYYPKRAQKACDRCRLKKVKCSGGKLCKRCESDGVVCITASNPIKQETPVDYRRYHLATSQRDRLLEILFGVLNGKNEDEIANLHGELKNMGLSVQNLGPCSPAKQDESAAVVLDSSVFEDHSESAWREFYKSLNNEELPELWLPQDEIDVAALADLQQPGPHHPYNQTQLPIGTLNVGDMVEYNAFSRSD